MIFGQNFKRRIVKANLADAKDAKSIKLSKSLRKKIQYAVPIFFIVMILCWGFFYNYTVHNMRQNSQRLTEQVLNSVVNTLESIFLNLEHTAMTLSQLDAVTQLLNAQTPIEFHERTSAVVDGLNSIYHPDGLTDNIIIFDSAYNYVRLNGELGNTVLSRAAFLLSEHENVRHLSFTSQDETYIAYITPIMQDDEKKGTVMFLLPALQLAELFNEHNEDNNLLICLLGAQSVFATNRQELLNMSITDLKATTVNFASNPIGLTPFEIFVADDGSNIQNSIQVFAIVTVATFLLMIFMQVLFYRFLSKNLLAPMFTIMSSANNVGKHNVLLSLTGNEDFDVLVHSINSMIKRLEQNTHELYDMQYKIKDSEIEKQNTLILSLKKQINAHFTVNTINNIKRLTELGKLEQAGEICDELSDLLRYANNADQFISAFEEMHVMRKYVSIMQVRYPGSFTVQFDVDDVLDDYYLPRMLIQPLIENAIVHGVQNAAHGEIYISAKLAQNNLIFEIDDNGKGIDALKLNELNENLSNIEKFEMKEGLSGVAVLNIQRRIRLAFGDEYGLKLFCPDGKGTQVVVSLPILKFGEN